MKITRVWAMPNKWTFTIKPIRELLQREVNGGLWCDPFAGENSPAQVTNDLNPSRPTTHHMEALEFLKAQETDNFDGVLFDPPYSPRQLKECYDNLGLVLHDTKSSVWKSWKDEIARVIKQNGLCMSFGWSSNGLGKERGFEIIEILLVAHGGNHNDTIVVVEKKK